ncbi:beta-glucosidase [Microbacterium sp. MYb64]|nr:beta-glucosidase [Microbacterium sp. MYb64]
MGSIYPTAPRTAPVTRDEFGADFTWGVSTASYQIEGAAAEGGRVRSAWDDFVTIPGHIRGGDTADVAADHFHRYREDVELMRELGVTAYRFSFAWPRIQSESRVITQGLDFYDRLVDELAGAGIEPVPTIFHWDTPSWVEARGGWRTRDVADRFADYSTLLADRFSDRIQRWMTLNEPVALTMLGHGVGLHAPGHTMGLDAVEVGANLLLAHGKSVAALRAAGVTSIGIANAHTPVWPVDDTAETRSAVAFYDALQNGLFMQPLLRGSWPAPLREALTHRDEDLATISAPIDWYGVNYYHPTAIGPAGAGGTPLQGEIPLPDGLPFSFGPIEGYPTSDFGWPVVPRALTELLVGMRDTYGDALPPIMITENGTSNTVERSEDGRFRDDFRIEFLAGHLAAVRDAQDAGVDVQGYFHWSLMDNFEWAEGYSQRFGIVDIDPVTQDRTPKDSYHWYRSFLTGSARS